MANLGFTKEFKALKWVSNFEYKILACWFSDLEKYQPYKPKIHTIRSDNSNQWCEGRKIHFATGIRTKQYNCFHESICTGTQQVYINSKHYRVVIHSVNGAKELTPVEIDQFARNDGFDTTAQFWEYFHTGFYKIIHWTKFKY